MSKVNISVSVDKEAKELALIRCEQIGISLSALVTLIFKSLSNGSRITIEPVLMEDRWEMQELRKRLRDTGHAGVLSKSSIAILHEEQINES